jgi:hypothetical protein
VRRIALLVGNEKFGPESGLTNLEGPCNDVKALESVLGDRERGEFEVSTFPDQPRHIVMPALEQVLGTVTQNDLMLLFYAGHGKLDRSGRLCLATADTQESALYSTSIPAAELRNVIANSSCGAVVLLLDCCYSGAAGREFTRGSVVEQLKLMQETQGLHVLTATTGYQTARELQSEPGGPVMGKFTHAIAEGVKSGSADSDNDGLITLYELRRYLEKTLRGQTPQYFAQAAVGDPNIAHAVTPMQKRQRRLGAWYGEGQIPDDIYSKIFAAANGEADPNVAALVQRLLDNPETTAPALVAAWKGVARPTAVNWTQWPSKPSIVPNISTPPVPPSELNPYRALHTYMQRLIDVVEPKVFAFIGVGAVGLFFAVALSPLSHYFAEFGIGGVFFFLCSLTAAVNGTLAVNAAIQQVPLPESDQYSDRLAAVALGILGFALGLLGLVFFLARIPVCVGGVCVGGGAPG